MPGSIHARRREKRYLRIQYEHTYTDDLGTHYRRLTHVAPGFSAGLHRAIILVLIIVLVGGFIAYRYWYIPRKHGNGALPWVKKS